MISLRLFHQKDPSRQIEARTLEAGDLVIGREPPGSGWKIADPDRQLSRTHCTISVRDGRISVCDTSSNGMHVGSLGGLAPKGERVLVQAGEVLTLGPFTIVIEAAAPGAQPTPAGFDPLSVSSTSGSPFAPPAGLTQDFGSRRPSDPFGAELSPDALDLDARPAGPPLGREAGASSFGEDAWDRRETRKAGDWDAPSRNRPQGHEHLIGSDRKWDAPPPPAKSEVGFGFDTPFERPILQKVEISRNDLEIPSDWDGLSLDPRPAAQPEPPPVVEPFVPRVAAVEPAPIVPPPAPAPTPEPVPMVPPPAPIIAPAPPPVVSAATTPASSPQVQAELLEAFCRGAKLDPSVFAREDPAVVMERVGAIYQQMVLGLADLISERSTVRNEYRMVRTTVRPAGNNPFKWAPAARLAVDLLQTKDDGFLTGPAAVKDSFSDMKKHVICLLAGLRAAVGATLDGLSPQLVETRAGRGLLKNPNAAAWAEFRNLYAEFKKQADDNPDSQINREFRAAYERQLETLDGLSPPG